MIRSVLVRLTLAAGLAVAGPVATTAQETTPEGLDWHLVQYADGADLVSVPWYVDATLHLENGEAIGSAGCNGFSGTYQLDGDSLTISQDAITLMGCADRTLAVERGYLAALKAVESWVVDSGPTGRFLHLRNDGGDDVLTFETPMLGLTGSDLRALAAELQDLQARIDRQEERIDDIRVGTLRDRIKTLEGQVKALRSAAATAARNAPNGAEKQLLRGVPARIRSTCQPLRTDLPSGTLAAVRCDPSSSLVAELAYYLMPYRSAEQTFERIMSSHSVPQRYRCDAGRPSRMLQSPYHATGCFVDGDAANVRLVTWAAECRQLDVDGKRVKEPATYIAIEGTGGRIAPLFAWATTSDAEFTPLWKDIPAGGKPRAPACSGLSG